MIQLLALLNADADLAILVTDGDLIAPGPTIVYASPALERMTGYSSAQLLGNSPRMLQGPKTSLAARKAMARAVRQGQRHRATVLNYRRSGEIYRCEIDLFPILEPGGGVVNVVAIEREVERRPGRRAAS